jgi:hypothetical protein
MLSGGFHFFGHFLATSKRKIKGKKIFMEKLYITFGYNTWLKMPKECKRVNEIVSRWRNIGL